jgi:hypothetical protein
MALAFDQGSEHVFAKQVAFDCERAVSGSALAEALEYEGQPSQAGLAACTDHFGHVVRRSIDLQIVLMAVALLHTTLQDVGTFLLLG